MNDARQVLSGAFRRALAAGKLDARDVRAIEALALTLAEARDVYDALLEDSWGSVIDDDALSPRECAGLHAIGAALALPDSCLPHPVRLAQTG